MHAHRGRGSEANYIGLLLRRDVAGIVFIGASYADAGPKYSRELREQRAATRRRPG